MLLSAEFIPAMLGTTTEDHSHLWQPIKVPFLLVSVRQETNESVVKEIQKLQESAVRNAPVCAHTALVESLALPDGLTLNQTLTDTSLM